MINAIISAEYPIHLDHVHWSGYIGIHLTTVVPLDAADSNCARLNWRLWNSFSSRGKRATRRWMKYTRLECTWIHRVQRFMPSLIIQPIAPASVVASRSVQGQPCNLWQPDAKTRLTRCLTGGGCCSPRRLTNRLTVEGRQWLVKDLVQLTRVFSFSFFNRTARDKIITSD